jgi:hypothetical protein
MLQKNKTNQMKTVAQKSIQQTTARLEESWKKKWNSKVMHDQYIRSSDSLLKKERSCSCRGELWKQKLNVK